jgi:hypothetical protein
MVPNIYLDENTMRVRFNTTTENLEIVYGTKIGSEFTSESGQTSNYTPQSFVKFDIIMSFHKSLTNNSLQGTYYRRSF